MKITKKPKLTRDQHAVLMLNDLLKVESGLSEWEMDFLDSLTKIQADRLSVPQFLKLEELWFDHCSPWGK